MSRTRTTVLTEVVRTRKRLDAANATIWQYLRVFWVYLAVFLPTLKWKSGVRGQGSGNEGLRARFLGGEFVAPQRFAECFGKSKWLENIPGGSGPL
jgi:hypothetical protein